MGRTKATIEIDGIPMAERVALALERCGCDPIALIGVAGELGGVDRVVFADDPPAGIGPIGGVLTALRQVPSLSTRPVDAVFVVACDLAYVRPEVLGRLIERFDPATCDAVVARTDRIEPGCVIWAMSAASHVEALVAAGERALHRALAAMRTVEVDVSADALRNINTPDDLDR